MSSVNYLLKPYLQWSLKLDIKQRLDQLQYHSNQFCTHAHEQIAMKGAWYHASVHTMKKQDNQLQTIGYHTL